MLYDLNGYLIDPPLPHHSQHPPMPSTTTRKSWLIPVKYTVVQPVFPWGPQKIDLLKKIEVLLNALK